MTMEGVVGVEGNIVQEWEREELMVVERWRGIF
jgi:hypothetical protein